jgi:hypothetical protein
MPILLKPLLSTLRRALPRPLVERLCARRLDRMAQRLLRMRARIDAMSRHLGADTLDTLDVLDGPLPRPASDVDGSLRRMLAGLRDEVGTMRRDLALWHMRECGGRAGSRLGAALTRLNRIALDTGAAALRLERELDEHERLRVALQSAVLV